MIKKIKMGYFIAENSLISTSEKCCEKMTKYITKIRKKNEENIRNLRRPHQNKTVKSATLKGEDNAAFLFSEKSTDVNSHENKSNTKTFCSTEPPSVKEESNVVEDFSSNTKQANSVCDDVSASNFSKQDITSNNEPSNNSREPSSEQQNNQKDIDILSKEQEKGNEQTAEDITGSSELKTSNVISSPRDHLKACNSHNLDSLHATKHALGKFSDQISESKNKKYNKTGGKENVLTILEHEKKVAERSFNHFKNNRELVSQKKKKESLKRLSKMMAINTGYKNKKMLLQGKEVNGIDFLKILYFRKQRRRHGTISSKKIDYYATIKAENRREMILSKLRKNIYDNKTLLDRGEPLCEKISKLYLPVNEIVGSLDLPQFNLDYHFFEKEAQIDLVNEVPGRRATLCPMLPKTILPNSYLNELTIKWLQDIVRHQSVYDIYTNLFNNVIGIHGKDILTDVIIFLHGNGIHIVPLCEQNINDEMQNFTDENHLCLKRLNGGKSAYLDKFEFIANTESRPKYHLVVVTAEVFEDAMRQCQTEHYELTHTNYFPKSIRMYLHIPVYKGGLINCRDNKDRRILP